MKSSMPGRLVVVVGSLYFIDKEIEAINKATVAAEKAEAE